MGNIYYLAFLQKLHFSNSRHRSCSCFLSPRCGIQEWVTGTERHDREGDRQTAKSRDVERWPCKVSCLSQLAQLNNKEEKIFIIITSLLTWNRCPQGHVKVIQLIFCGVDSHKHKSYIADALIWKNNWMIYIHRTVIVLIIAVAQLSSAMFKCLMQETI